VNGFLRIKLVNRCTCTYYDKVLVLSLQVFSLLDAAFIDCNRYFYSCLNGKFVNVERLFLFQLSSNGGGRKFAGKADIDCSPNMKFDVDAHPVAVHQFQNMDANTVVSLVFCS